MAAAAQVIPATPTASDDGGIPLETPQSGQRVMLFLTPSPFLPLVFLHRARNPREEESGLMQKVVKLLAQQAQKQTEESRRDRSRTPKRKPKDDTSALMNPALTR